MQHISETTSSIWQVHEPQDFGAHAHPNLVRILGESFRLAADLLSIQECAFLGVEVFDRNTGAQVQISLEATILVDGAERS